MQLTYANKVQVNSENIDTFFNQVGSKLDNTDYREKLENTENMTVSRKLYLLSNSLFMYTS